MWDFLTNSDLFCPAIGFVLILLKDRHEELIAQRINSLTNGFTLFTVCYVSMCQ